MKFYETHYEEYIQAVETYNLHPELEDIYNQFPQTYSQLQNMIVYGGSGVGKYSQVLYLLKRYSPSGLKYEKKITIVTEKQTYIYRISDIHYEIDMSLLGCNSKMLFHEIYSQIVDIVSMKPEKQGILVCKNFHLIHNELLEIFYSYIQQNHTIQLKFILITEHISFIPNKILNRCFVLAVPSPSKEQRLELYKHTQETQIPESTENVKRILEETPMSHILNNKEIPLFSMISPTNQNEVPKDNFNIICDTIIYEIVNYQTMTIPHFRDVLYDILIYNLDVAECLWYVLSYFIKCGKLTPVSVGRITPNIFLFLKYFQNNYRPIFHLENIFLRIMYEINTNIKTPCNDIGMNK